MSIWQGDWSKPLPYAWSVAKEHVLVVLVDPGAVLVRLAVGPEAAVVRACWAGLAMPETRETLSSSLSLFDDFMKGL